ncbi:hypothetical protein [Paenibacillus lentus]|uniref:Uncharacterized protein n=1 Tax=Paenibacillus lentus TaxID=1338368 RepID=A0A3Q8SCJ5_9BACL|nr:hypothetical protein [Paenibacillus lentus]AZK47493.1 hypothetical protein EIM92_16155 [Paenibacillus lentus]
MFDYADTLKVKMRLGQYVAHRIVKDGFTSKIVRSPEQLNKMDRFELAKDFLSSNERKYFDRDLFKTPEPEKLLDDVARYIDQRIPKAYANWFNYGNNVDEEWSAEKYGLTYQFEENGLLEAETREKSNEWNPNAPASKEQVQYLKALLSQAGYILKISYDDLTRGNASQLISFLVDDDALPADIQKLLEYE